MKHTISVVLLITFCLFAKAQKQGSVWFTEMFSGLNFNGPNPTCIGGTSPPYFDNITGRGSNSIISDSAGNHLMHSDGNRIWNRTLQVMPNGDSLTGFARCTQNSLIVPLPGSSRYFYVFVPNVGYNTSTYSVVDICRDGGYGDVIPSKKNINLLPGFGTEKVAAVRHANGVDYWILMHKRYTNEFFAFLLTANGITDTVISAIGGVHQQTQGEMKLSSDGTRLAVSATTNGNVMFGVVFELFDFDRSTGMLSNPKSLFTSGAIINGLAFSPDKSKLYASFSGRALPYVYGIYQYDLSAGGGNVDSINASINMVYSTTNSVGSSRRNIQLGPDNEIYGSHPLNGTPLLHIQNPNGYGPACNLDTTGVICGYGEMPNLVTGYSYSNKRFVCPTCPQNYQVAVTPAVSNICPGDTARLCPSANWSIYQWSNGETGRCLSTQANGEYSLTVTEPNGCSAEYGPVTVNTFPVPSVSISVNGNLLTAYGGTAYQWYLNGYPIHGATGPEYQVTQAGSYTIAVADNHNCIATSLPVVISNIPEAVTHGIKVYSPDGIHLKIETDEVMDEILIFDLEGRQLKTFSNSANNIIEINDLQAGIYLLRVKVKGIFLQTKWSKF